LVDTVLVKAEPLDGSAVVVLMALNIVTLDVLGLNGATCESNGPLACSAPPCCCK